MSAVNFHNFLIFILHLGTWNSHKCKLQGALSCRDSYINLFLGQFPCGDFPENTAFLHAIIFAQAQIVGGSTLRYEK